MTEIQETTAITLRQAVPNEWAALSELVVGSYREFAASMGPSAFRQYEESIHQTIREDKRIRRFVALSNDEIIGGCILCPAYELELDGQLVKNPFPEMRLLAVTPSHRNTGVGASLVSFCEDLTRTAGDTAVTLHTTEVMKTAKHMYERRGYERFPDIDFKGFSGLLVMGYVKYFNKRSDKVDKVD